MTFIETLRALARDVRQYDLEHPTRSILLIALENLYRHPALAGVINYRIGSWLYHRRHHPLVFCFYFLYRLLYPFVRLYSGLELSPRAQIAPGLCALHFGPIVIHPNVVAGENLTILHRVTIGAAKSGTPRLGDNVAIGVGASIIGGLTIGNNVSIGAGAIVTRDIPSNCSAVGMPARPIPYPTQKHSQTNGRLPKPEHDEFLCSPSVFAELKSEL